MAPDDAAQTSERLHKQNVRRAREFYRYLEPHNLLHPNQRRRGSTFDAYHEHVPSLVEALSPYCQLTAMRCNVRKVMLNFMDRDTMYFLSEASRQITYKDGKETVDFVEDPILMSCTAVPIEGRICELTVRMDGESSQGLRPMFVIPDLLESEFSHLPVISGPPYYRFYAGVPITSRKGINIGSLAIMDDQPRTALTPTEEEFLSKTAAQVMAYLEINRQAIEGRRARRMAQGLESFIAGRGSMEETDDEHSSLVPQRNKSSKHYGISLECDHDETVKSDQRKDSATKASNEDDVVIERKSHLRDTLEVSESDLSQARKDKEESPDSHVKIFSRAANLLHQSLDLGDEGTATFLSIGSRLAGSSRSKQSHSSQMSDGSNDLKADDSSSKSSAPSSLRKPIRPATVVAHSSPSMPSAEADAPGSSTMFDELVLQELAKKYPAGRIWNFDDAQSSSEDDSWYLSTKHASDKEPVQRGKHRKGIEASTIQAAFSFARQVLFVPLYDASAAAFSHCLFVASALDTRSFGSSDISFLHSFCSTVMGENMRLDALLADKQKSDFVGTISHEMRSPLHGVLASVEFLAESELTSFQKSLVDTIDSCGKTLLDTINHVLDYSKVNSFQKQWEASNKKTSIRRGNFLGPENTSKALSNGAPPLLQLFGITDVSAILEEVVDGLVLGQSYRSGIDITDVSQEARGKRGSSRMGSGLAIANPESTKIIIDIQPANWSFLTQPGALRRIIMNITGNAIKYTSRGSINVKLELRENVQEKEPHVMLFSVTDTGKGISPQFLASRLFVPFAQENALAPGTGLGLSIVHSIVTMLGGSIDVKSIVGHGTTVEVVLPLKRPLPGQSSTNHTPSSVGTAWSGSSNSDDSISILQNQASDCEVAYFKSAKSADIDQSRVVSTYIKEWFNMELSQLPQSASVVITDEEDFEELLQVVIGTPGTRPALVVLCSIESRHSVNTIRTLEYRVGSAVEFVAKPLGPHKLARSIRLVLEKKRTIRPGILHNISLDSIKEASGTSTSESDSGRLRDDMQEMDLSSPGEANLAKAVTATEHLAVSQMSVQGQMALNSPRVEIPLKSPGARFSEGNAFPFPEQEQEQSRRRRESYRGANPPTVSDQNPANATVSVVGPNTSGPTAAIAETAQKVNPRVLLVDDNKINLKLLETFLTKKRSYSNISQAEDGQQAVDAVVSASEPFDIIFMDISMPIMNGFEATRTIREHEDRTRVETGSLIIALTGLASGKDQSDGFESGCDIYMTKPVSFKEVTKLLDNWEAHQRVAVTSEGESGAVT